MKLIRLTVFPAFGSAYIRNRDPFDGRAAYGITRAPKTMFMGYPMVYDPRVQHFHRPDEASFTADEREEVTILLGGLTWKHEHLIQAVLQRNGYRSECLAQPDREAHEIGKEYCGNNLCNPVYFMVGNLIKRLHELEQSGLSRAEIVRRYIFFTAGSSGPCRFGMLRGRVSAQRLRLRTLTASVLCCSFRIMASKLPPASLGFSSPWISAWAPFMHLSWVTS